MSSPLSAINNVLPTIGSGDAGKVLTVNSDGDGMEWIGLSIISNNGTIVFNNESNKNGVVTSNEISESGIYLVSSYIEIPYQIYQGTITGYAFGTALSSSDSSASDIISNQWFFGGGNFTNLTEPIRTLSTRILKVDLAANPTYNKLITRYNIETSSTLTGSITSRTQILKIGV